MGDPGNESQEVIRPGRRGLITRAGSGQLRAPERIQILEENNMASATISFQPSAPAAWQEKPSQAFRGARSEEHTSELQSQSNLVCRLLLEKKKKIPLCKPDRCLVSITPRL